MGKEIQGLVDQMSPNVSMEGNSEKVPISKLGELFTVDWHQRLALAGRVFTLNLGTMTGDTSYSALTGNLTALDNDQPEVIIAIDSGWLIPIEIDIGISVNDNNAYGDFTQIVFAADRTQTEIAGRSGTIATALNLLDGGPAFAGRCYTILTSGGTTPASV